MENEHVEKARLVGGYASVPRWVMRSAFLSVYELSVLFALAGRANKENVCWPSHEVIAREASCSPRMVRKALKGLREKGLVSWRRRVLKNGYNDSNLYELYLKAPENGDDEQSDDEPDDEPDARHTMPSGAAHDAVLNGTESHSGTAQCAEEVTTNEVTKEKYIYMSETSDNNSGEDAKPKRKRRGYSDEFEQFWKIYPRTRDGKFEASKAFAKALTVTDLETILDGAYRYANDPNRSDAYTKMASTWLNKRCWDDGPLPARGSGRRTMSERLRGEYDTLMASSTVPQARQLESGGRW